MTDRDKLLADFVTASLALMCEGLGGLSPEKALQVAQAQAAGADVVLGFAPGVGAVVGCLHFPDPDADTPELFRIVVPFPEASTN